MTLPWEQPGWQMPPAIQAENDQVLAQVRDLTDAQLLGYLFGVANGAKELYCIPAMREEPKDPESYAVLAMLLDFAASAIEELARRRGITGSIENTLFDAIMRSAERLMP